MFSWLVRDLEDVEGDSVDRGLAQGVQPRDIRAFVVDLLKDLSQLGVVVMFELNLSLVRNQNVFQKEFVELVFGLPGPRPKRP